MGGSPHLLEAWGQVAPLLAAAQALFLGLDYDGTLAPITPRPEMANIPGGVLAALVSLLQNPFIAVAIISGRSLEDLKSQVGLEGLVYAGNHGLELAGPDFHYVHPLAHRSQPLIRRIYDELVHALSHIGGVVVEDKGFTLSVHHRLVAEEEVPLVLRLFEGVTWPLRQFIRVTTGKRVLEVRPLADWDKGRAFLWLEARCGKPGVLPLYLGDDRTDEDVFRILEGRGLGIRVGEPSQTRAGYYLRNSEEVGQLLQRLGSWRPSHAPLA